MLNEQELRNLIDVERKRNECILDEDARRCHRGFILGLEAALND